MLSAAPVTIRCITFKHAGGDLAGNGNQIYLGMSISGTPSWDYRCGLFPQQSRVQTHLSIKLVFYLVLLFRICDQERERRRDAREVFF